MKMDPGPARIVGGTHKPDILLKSEHVPVFALREIIALRHQLTVLQRTQERKRLVLNRGDRCLWIGLSQLWIRKRRSDVFVSGPVVTFLAELEKCHF